MLHEQYHSPFGWIFFAVSSLAMSLRETVAPESSATGVMISAALVFFVVVLAAFLLLRASLGSRAMPVWLLPFLLVLSASPRNISELSHRDLLWYGMYNNQLWSLVLMQLVAFFSLLLNDSVRTRIFSCRARMISLCLAQALVLYVALNYKVSFFLAGLALALATLIVIGRHRALMPFTLSASVLVAMLGATHLAGYNYEAYLSDLMMAVRAREEGSTGLGGIVWYAGVLLALCIVYLDPTRLAVVRRRGAATSMSVATVSMVLAMAALVLGLMGDFSKSLMYLFLFLALYLVAHRHTGHEAASRIPMFLSFGILAVIFTVNTLSVARVVDYKVGDVDSKRYVVSTHAARWGGDWHLVLPRPHFGSQVEEWAAVFGKYNDGWFSLALKAAGNLRIMYTSVDYMVSHQEALSMFEKIGVKPDAMVVELEFSNSFPVLWGSPTPPGSLHWVHHGTTISNDSYIKAFEPYFSADVVLLPGVGFDFKQPHMNCVFLIENRLRGSPFEVQYVDRYWIMLAPPSSGLSWPTEYTDSDHERFEDLVDANCSGVAPLFYGSEAREKMDTARRTSAGHH